MAPNPIDYVHVYLYIYLHIYEYIVPQCSPELQHSIVKCGAESVAGQRGRNQPITVVGIEQRWQLMQQRPCVGVTVYLWGWVTPRMSKWTYLNTKRDSQKRCTYMKRNLQKRPTCMNRDLLSHATKLVFLGSWWILEAESRHACQKRSKYMKRDPQRRPT